MSDAPDRTEIEASRHFQPGSVLAPFRYPAFRAIWIANLASNLGSMAQAVGAAWLMTGLTKSHLLIALVPASSTLPIMLFGMFAGAIADNYDRRYVMLAAQVGMLIAAALLALITWMKLANPAVLLFFTLAIGIGTALNGPAWQASVRLQVGMRDLPQAISLNTISFNLARSVGPALGGLLISLWDVSFAFALNAVSYIFMITVLWRWRPELPPPARRPILPAIAIGLRFCAGSAPIRKVLLRGLVVGFGFSAYQALVPSLVRGQMQGTEIDYGLMLGMFGIGSVISALFVSKARRRWGAEAITSIAMLTFAIGQSLLAESYTLGFGLFAALVAGLGWVTALTSTNVAMQMRSPEDILGRCLSIYQAVTFGGMAVGAWSWGMIADWRGTTFALHAAGGWLVATLILLRLFAPMPLPSEGRIEH